MCIALVFKLFYPCKREPIKISMFILIIEKKRISEAGKLAVIRLIVLE